VIGRSIIPAERKISRGIIAIAVVNLVLGLLCLVKGAVSALIDTTLLMQLVAGSAVDIPPAPQELVLFERLNGMETFLEGVLLLGGGIGLLLLANWARVATLVYAGLAIVASVTSLVIYVLYIGPLSAPWNVQVTELLSRIDGSEVATAPGFEVLARQLCGFPALCYSVFLFLMLNRPSTRQAFGVACASGAPPADDIEDS